MKKVEIVFVLFFVLFQLAAKEEKVFEMSWRPKTYFEFLDRNFEKYWRFPEKDKDKVMASDFGVMLESFEHNVKQLQIFLHNSGLMGVENIESESNKISDDTKSYFFTETEVEFDGETQGFLQGLLKKLPEHKIPKVENEEELSDLHVINEDTLLAFDLPLNFNEAFKALPKDFSWLKALERFSAEFFDMKSDEFIDRITGEWGGVIYVDRQRNMKNDISLDFIFIVPDPEQKFYKKLGEELVLRRWAVYKKELLNVRIWAKYPDITLVPLDDLLIVCSSPQALMKFQEIAEKKKVSENIKKINVPEDLEYDAFCYWNRDFSAVANSLFHNKSHPLGFMKDFGGSEVFSALEIDDDELEIKSYSDASLAQIMLMPYTVSALSHADSIIYKKGRNAFVENQLEKLRKECLADLRRYAAELKKYAAENDGSYPQGINGAGLKKLADFAKIPKGKFALKQQKKVIPYGRFYYWGENCRSKSAKLPLLTDRGGIHKNKLHVVFCDGSVREFELKNVRSARRIASYLHTVFRYDSETFVMLMKQAQKLDKENL